MSELTPAQDPPTASLLADIRALIDQARQQTAVAVNAGLTLMYWRIGQRIHADVLGGARAAYGGQIVSTLSRQLVSEYGRGFAVKNLRHRMRFAAVFPDEQIVYALSRQLSWMHFRSLLYLDKPWQRDFYAEIYRIEGLNARALQNRIDEAIETARARIEAKGNKGGWEKMA